MSETAIVIWEDKTQLATIKKTLVPSNVNDQEFQLFMSIGKAMDANPFLREIYITKYGDKASIILARDLYRKNAQKSKEYDWHLSDDIYSKDTFSVKNGEVSHEYNLSERGTLIGAYALCQRKGSSKPNFIRVDFKEYNTGKSVWAGKPSTMIKKVAEAQVLRMTFQDLFANTYDESEEFDDSNNRTGQETTATSDVSKRISGKSEEVTPEPIEVDENGEVVVEAPVVYISEEQSSKITNLFTQLGYDPAAIIEKRESLERRLGKPYDQFTQEEADSIISNMEKALKKRMEEEKTAEAKEEKKSAVGAMGEKTKAEQEAIKESPEFKATFPEETPAVETPKEEKEDVLSGESFEEVFGGGEEGIEAEGLENATEEELRKMRADAKVAFSEAVKKYKADGSNVNLAERTRTSAICSDINQMLIKKGYDIV